MTRASRVYAAPNESSQPIGDIEPGVKVSVVNRRRLVGNPLEARPSHQDLFAPKSPLASPHKIDLSPSRSTLPPTRASKAIGFRVSSFALQFQSEFVP
jgi:hypothetical protein